MVGAYNAADNTVIRKDNNFLYKDTNDPNALPVSVLPNGGLYNRTENRLTQYITRNTLEYNKDFNGGKHELRVYGGVEVRATDRQSTFNDGYGIQYQKGNVVFTDPNIFQKLAQNSTPYFGNTIGRVREVTLFATATYAFNEKYVFSATANYEGSNRSGMSAQSRWLPTWNLGGKWNIIDEPFMKGNIRKWISNLSFRPSYGLSALLPNIVSNNLPVFRSDITNRLLQSNRENLIYIQDLQNVNLTWEKKYELNLGLDVGLLNNKISISVDNYYRRGLDLIDLIQTSGVGGQLDKYANNANMNTNGLEIQINTRNIQTPNFKWSTTFNFSHYRQKITKLEQRNNVYNLVTGTGGQVEGRPQSSLYSFQLDKLDNRGLPQFIFNDDRNPITGINFQEIDNILQYLKYEGPTQPPTTGGLSNTFEYKNWSFSFFLTFSMGNKMRLRPSYFSEYSDLSIFTKDFRDRWVVAGDEQYTNVPVIASRRLIETLGDAEAQRVYNAYNYSDVRIVDGDFIRMKNIALSYKLQIKVLREIGISNLQISLQATNPFLVYSSSKLRGQDPEFYNTGGVSLPLPKQYTLSLDIKL